MIIFMLERMEMMLIDVEVMKIHAKMWNMG
jgi:hypothetical protein